MLGPTRARSGALRLIAAVLVAGGLTALSHDPAAGATAHRDDDRPPARSAPAGQLVEDEYIVAFKGGVGGIAEKETLESARSDGGGILHRYRHAIHGFAARLPDQALKALRNNPNVDYIEPNRTVTAYGDQNDPPWGLDRIDQRARALTRTYHYDRTGAGVDAYIIDTGIRITHAQFGTRASHGFTSIADGNGANDCNGHGTHVAGTVGSTRYGVAKAVKLIAVRVLDCNGDGTNAGVIAGVDFVASDHVPGRPAVANMSLGGGFSQTLNDAVANGIADGVTFVVAAGNSNQDACNFSPASAPAALTVGATTYTDARASYSNFGTCLDLFAPGSQVLSTYKDSNLALDIINGTSMASPHVAGVVATYLQRFRNASPATVANAIRNSATPNRLSGIGAGSPNKLLYSKFGSTITSPPPPVVTNKVAQPGFESGPGIWQGTEATINCADGDPPPRSGRCHVWLNGYGVAVTDMLGQRGIVVPAGSPRLRFFTRITTGEIGSTPFDKLHVRVIAGGTSTTVLTLSNANASAGYVVRSVPLAAFAGQTVEVRFVGVEDASVATSFYIDDVFVG